MKTTDSDILPENYRLLQASVYAQAGIVLNDDKHYLFQGRLTPVAQQLGFNSINDLCSVLKVGNDTHLIKLVAEAMTTNETYFFRDPQQYELIRTVLLPRLCQQRTAQSRLRFWSAACSTGQEAYSLAMTLSEYGMGNLSIEILGTDFCSQVVERARSGRYQQVEVNRGLPAPHLVKHFRRAGMHWQINDAIRATARFETFDLRQSMRTLGPFELVFCRNVMIYLDSATKYNILRQIHSTLFRGGWLLLGGSETANNVGDLFETQRFGNAVVYVAR